MEAIAKTKDTVAIEMALMGLTEKKRTFGCPEVTIGWYGKKRVDFVETNTRGVIKCYEIKVSKTDFHSKHGHTFIGNYNYYAMTKELYEEVKDEIPPDIGVMLLGSRLMYVAKSAKYKKINNNSEIIMYLLRSMSREVKKSFGSKDEANLAYWKREAYKAKKALGSAEDELRDIRRENTRLFRKLSKVKIN